MKVPQETLELTQFRRLLTLSGLLFPARRCVLLRLQQARLLAYFCTVLLWNWALSRIPLQQIPRKSYTPIVIWSNAHLLTVLFVTSRSPQIRAFADGLAALLRTRTPDERLLFQRRTSLTWKWIAASFGHVLVICLVVSFLPSLVDLGFLLLSSSTVPFYIPMTLEGFLPDTRRRSFAFYALNLANGLLVVVPSVYYVALLTALPATVTYLHFELEVFQQRLRTWARDRTDPDRKAVLRQVVLDHAELLRLINIIKEVLGTAFATQNFVTSINTGFLMHAAKKALREKDVMLITQQVYFFTQLLGVTFLCCYIGEILYHKGEEVSRSLYSLPWYEESPPTRRDLHMVLIATQRPIVLDLKKKLPLNLETFAELMNRAYTIFLLLDSLE